MHPHLPASNMVVLASATHFANVGTLSCTLALSVTRQLSGFFRGEV